MPEPESDRELLEAVRENLRALKGLRRLATQTLQLNADLERRLQAKEQQLIDRIATGGIANDHQGQSQTTHRPLAQVG